MMPPTNDNNNHNNQQPDGLSIFCREVRNLLRSKPNCTIPFSKFVPAYHNHYGRQCCVYQFGYTKLIELLEAIPHVVQINGDGTQRYITLTHREQIKRFASDLIKVVKSQPGKKLKLSQFAKAYEQVLGRIFRVNDYGTDDINVLLAEIWEGTINIMPIKRELADASVTRPLFVNEPSKGNNLCLTRSSFSNNNNNNNNTICNTTNKGSTGDSCDSSHTDRSSIRTASNNSLSSIGFNKAPGSAGTNFETINKPYITEQYPDAWFEIPRRERSEKEIRRTRYFIWDVIELLSQFKPDYSVTFSKFIPSYHYYFNRQCKVSIFGFSKLIDLFEFISPDVVEIIDQGAGEEKIIRLARQHWPAYKQQQHRRNYQRRQPSYNHHHSHNQSQQITRPLLSCGLSNLKLPPLKHQEEEDYEPEAEDNDNQSEVVDKAETETETETDEEYYEDEDEEVEGDDVIVPSQAIDNGPTEEEIMELEQEIRQYKMQNKKSSRMAAILDVFKYSIY